jgi:hypothetical protein
MEFEIMEDNLFKDMKRDPFSTYPLDKKEIERLYISNRIFRYIMYELNRILSDETKPEAIRIGDARQLIFYTLGNDDGTVVNNIPTND